MKTKHTQGPWVFDELSMKIKGSGDIEGMTVIANVSPKMDYSRGMRTQCANAKLIAAAPDLLEACIRSLQVLGEENIFGQARLLLVLAIKKATE